MTGDASRDTAMIRGVVQELLEENVARSQERA